MLTRFTDVSTLLADATEEDIQTFQMDLRKAKNRTSVDLQDNVFRNRTQFIKISKEAEKLKGEMRMLRNLMSELTGALGQATSAGSAGADTAKARRLANRSSVANLEALWNTHLQTLWKRVEGSQKYLPAIPGRHIVYESSRWVELNVATWKPRKRVHLIMLNDHLLVAAEKKRAEVQTNGNARDKQATQQLVAIRCWPLQDVQMVDLARREPGTGEKVASSNAINVRVGADSFTFSTGSSEAAEKVALLTTFRRTVEDLRKNQEMETQERAKGQDTAGYLAARDPGVLRNPALMDSLEETSIARTDILIDVDGKPQSIRWVEAQIDDLDIDIALQKFEEAVARLENLRRIAKGIKGNSVAQNIVTLKLNERAAKLEAVISRYLKDTHAWITSTRRNVDWLVRLGFEDRAREAYLEARSEIIKKRIRFVICILQSDLNMC
jgi:exocyst complex component 8